MAEYIILTDERDQYVGVMEKLLVHKLGLLHRAFSVFIFNTKGEMLLQQRAKDKYHSGGLWSNACCSHPRFEEKVADAVNRRLWEEMGISCETSFAFSFIYKASFENGLTEHEYDHVYVGSTDDIPQPNKSEVDDFKYVTLPHLLTDIEHNPANYSEWLKLSLPKIVSQVNTSYLQPMSQSYANVSI